MCINCDSLHRYGGLLDSHYRLRYRTFIEQRYWGGVRSFRGREYDEYDVPAAHYLIRPSPQGAAWGCLRLSPTDRPYMLKDKWPEMCVNRPLPESMSVWEVTRLCVDQSLPRAARTEIRNELIGALLEFGLKNDVRQFVAVAHPSVWRSAFMNAGWEVEFLNRLPTMLDGDLVQAGMIAVNVPLLESVREALGIDRSVLLLS